MVFFGKMFIFMSAFCSLFFGPSVMKPLWLLSFIGLADAREFSLEFPWLSRRSPVVECLARGSVCNFAISETFLPRGLGELSGVDSISLKAKNYIYY